MNEQRIYTLFIEKEKIGVFTCHVLSKFIFGQARKPINCQSNIWNCARNKGKIKGNRTVIGKDCYVRFSTSHDISVLGNDTYYLFTDKYNHLIWDSFTSFSENKLGKQMSIREKIDKYSNEKYLAWLKDNDTGEFHSIQFNRFIKSVK